MSQHHAHPPHTRHPLRFRGEIAPNEEPRTKNEERSPHHPTFAALCARLNRSPVYVRGLQRRFALPIPADSPSPPRPGASARETLPNQERRTKNEERGVSYIGPYFSFLETLIHLRVLGIPEETLLHLWTIERKLMQLLHADSTGSPTWFLDACGSTANPDHRLLLSNFDIDAHLPSGAIQIELNIETKPHRNSSLAPKWARTPWRFSNNTSPRTATSPPSSTTKSPSSAPPSVTSRGQGEQGQGEQGQGEQGPYLEG